MFFKEVAMNQKYFKLVYVKNQTIFLHWKYDTSYITLYSYSKKLSVTWSLKSIQNNFSFNSMEQLKTSDFQKGSKNEFIGNKIKKNNNVLQC